MFVRILDPFAIGSYESNTQFLDQFLGQILAYLVSCSY